MDARRLTYLPGLDGLRALAVIGVLLYHAGVSWLPGGYLGVEVFFVVSGYLITALLLSEWREQGRIDLKTFWMRRARRLLPALFLLIAATLAYAIVLLPDEVATLRADATAAVGYVTNWYLIFNDQSYFESVGRPSLLRHLWSLAVEEQFYLLWPVLFAVMMRFLRPHVALLVIAVGAVASSLLMALLYQPDSDPSRLYYGTDTRAAGLLIGAALALVWAPWRRHVVVGRAKVALPDIVGVSALAILIWLFVSLDELHPSLYRGGFAAVALTSAVLIGATVHPRSLLIAGLLSSRLLRWIGLRSYSIYLWHWPIFMLSRPQLDLPLDGLSLLALRLAVTLLLAEVSYQLVELPVRSGALNRAWRALREAHGAQRWQAGLRWAVGGSTVLALAVSAACAESGSPPVYLTAEAVHTVVSSATPAATSPAAAKTVVSAISGDSAAFEDSGVAEEAAYSAESTPTPAQADIESDGSEAQAEASVTVEITQAPTPSSVVSTPVPIVTEVEENEVESLSAEGTLSAADTAPSPVPSTPEPAVSAREQTAPVEATPAPTQATPTPAPSESPAPVAVGYVLAIGDSVMLGAVNQLAQVLGTVEVDAAVSRQASAVIDILRARSGQLPNVVVIHIGNNGTFSEGQFDQIMQILGAVRRVVFVNLKVPRQWEAPNNAVIAAGVQRYANAVLVDWHGASSGRPELFWDDGIHLRPEGAAVYANLIAASASGR